MALTNRTCSVPTCLRKHYGRGYCNTHHGRWRRTGDVDAKTPIIKTEHGHAARGRFSPTYRSWSSMIQRTSIKPHSREFKYYRGRGILVCDKWRNFESFLKDMGERPEGTTLERVDVNGNYEPGNCEWAAWSTQVYNRRPRENTLSKYRGVCTLRGRWRSYITTEGQRIWIGVYDTQEEAAWMYDQWSIALYGGRAITNFTYTSTPAT